MTIQVESLAPRCRETAGFLFSHPCKNPSTGNCGRCGKPICLLHTRMIDVETVCVGCERMAVQEDPSMMESRQDDPFYYASSRYHDYGSGGWSTADEDAFAAGAAGGAAEDGWEQDWDAS